MAPRTAAEDLALAEGLQRRSTESPRGVVAAGRTLLARRDLGPEARSVTHRAVALALRGLDQPQDAVREARRAAAVAGRAGSRAREAEARLTLSLCQFQCGRVQPAVEQLERARELATGTTALLVAAQHGILLARLGRLDEARARYAEALAGALPRRDRVRVLNNRAIALAFAGRSGEAVRDLEAAIVLAREEGADLVVAELTHNLGFALAVGGDLPGALRRFDEADAAFVAAEVPIGLNLLARARALLASNLYREARTAAGLAVTALGAGGASADVAEARVLLAAAELADDEPARAVATAGLARRALVRQGRPGLVAVADHVIVRARASGRRLDRRLVARAVTCADALASSGFVAEELDARLTAALIARRRGQRDVARVQLDAVRAHRSRGPLLDRARAWHAEVICRLDDGDRAGARRAVGAGLDVVATLQSLMGGTELQVGVAGHGEALARLGLGLTLEDGDAWAVLRLLERRRNTSLGLRRHGDEVGTAWEDDAVGGGDPLAQELAALRAAASRLGQAVAEGADPTPARRALTIAELRVRSRARYRAGGRTARRGPRGSGSLRQRLAEAPLRDSVVLAYFELDGRVGLVATTQGRATLHHRLALDVRDVERLVGSALFALRRLARAGVGAASRAAASASLEQALGELD